MLRILLVFMFLVFSGLAGTSMTIAQDEQATANPLAVQLTRMLAKDIFELNSIPFLEPLVVAANASTNAGFYRNAWIPAQDTLYFRFSMVAMGGFVGETRQFYTPALPTDPVDNSGDGSVSLTEGLYNELLTIFDRGVQSGDILLPERAATIFGPTERVKFVIPTDFLLTEVQATEFYQELELFREDIDNVIESLPQDQELPGGADMSVILAAVPQLEIGALWGSELLLRYIPPVRFDDNVGDLSFFGVALRHSISQYFNDEPTLDLAVQGAFQTTSIENTIGVTEAKLEADADIFNFNIHASKTWDEFTAYGGLAFERIEVATKYTYTLPRETQISLNLLKRTEDGDYVVDGDKYPGDTEAQTSEVDITDNNLKASIGVMYTLNPVSIFVDYSFSEFDILAGGIMVSF